MPDSEEILEALDCQVPTLSASAFNEAYNKARAAGLSVYISEDTSIVKVNPNGTRQVIKHIEPRLNIPVGTTYEIP
jgi:hypothetical protein